MLQNDPNEVFELENIANVVKHNWQKKAQKVRSRLTTTIEEVVTELADLRLPILTEKGGRIAVSVEMERKVPKHHNSEYLCTNRGK